MGEAKNTRKRFFELHPNCCFCGGNAPATTYDEQPPRAYFVDRKWPIDFRFPACEPCNAGSRDTDLVVAMVGRLFNPDEDAYRESDVRRIHEGIKNNAPHLIPDLFLPTREKRKVAREMGFKPPLGHTYADLPIVGLDGRIFEYLERFVLKLTKALFYKERGSILGPNAAYLQMIRNNIPHWSDDQISNIIANLPAYQGSRWNNRDISDQFCYRWHNNEEQGLFAFAGAFAGAFLGFGACIADKNTLQESQRQRWVDADGRPLNPT